MTTLTDILINREERTAYRKKLSEKYHLPHICFQVNSPGPIKYTRNSCLIHSAGTSALLEALYRYHLQSVHTEIRHKETGIEGFFVINCESLFLKSICCEIEEIHLLGRLFDMDVDNPKGEPVNRDRLGYPIRPCLLCGGDVIACRREGKHSLNEYNDQVQKLIEDFLRSQQFCTGNPVFF